MKHDELISYLDECLQIRKIKDISQNGLQVQGPAEVEKLAVAVDTCQTSIDQAVEAGAQLLFVHHGLIWDHPLKITGSRSRYVKKLIENDCGLYGVHIPLDIHPEWGNNPILGTRLGLQETRPFGDYMGTDIGLVGELHPPLAVPELTKKLEGILGVPLLQVLAHGPENASRVAIVTGSAMSMVDQVEDAGCDTYITGETEHWHFHEAADRHLNVFFGGHYATETLGVKAVARHLEEKFGLETVFLDIPTGL